MAPAIRSDGSVAGIPIGVAVKNLGTVCLVLLGAMVPPAAAQLVESPTTVPRGTWLLEADLVAGVWNQGRVGNVSVSTREILAAPFILSTGLSERIDVQVAFDGWVEAEAEAAGRRERVAGWGDVWLRTKWNFCGDEATGPAWAILPYVKLPTADREIGNGEVEGGVALLYGQPIDEDDWMEAFVSGDSLRSDIRGRDELLVAGVVWGRNVTDSTTVYTEILAEWLSSEHADVPVNWGIGLSPTIAEGIALDFELLVGVTEVAPDWAAAIRLVWEL